MTTENVKMQIRNAKTNLVGRTRNERIVSREEWVQSLRPAIQRFFKSHPCKSHKALIGKWVVEYLGNDEHMYEFFTRNWKTADSAAAPLVRSYVLNGVTDRESMMAFRGVQGEEDLAQLCEKFLKDLENQKYRNAFKDPRIQEIQKALPEEQREIALFAPSTVYCPEEAAFVSINTNYYGQLKSKSSLGPLEEILTRKAKLDGRDEISNPADVWISMHAGAVEYPTEKGEKKGIVLIAPTGTGKSTQGYGLVEAKPEAKLHSDDWVFVNIASREVLISEDQFYMRANIAEIYPHLIPLLVNEPLENVAFTPEIVELIETFESPEDLRKGIEDGRVSRGQYHEIVEQMIENNDARSLIDPRIMVGKKKFIETMRMTNLFLLKRDFNERFILRNLTPKQMEDVMTSNGNVHNHVYGKVDSDGYGIPTKRTTEIYYNPYLPLVEVDKDQGLVGKLDKIRIACYRALACCGKVTVSWINTRLPANQTQLCIRKFLEGGVDEIRLIKGIDIEDSLLKRLCLTKREKPLVEGRREIDRVGLVAEDGEEVEVVAFFSQERPIEALALSKSSKVDGQLKAYSEGRPRDFFKQDETILAENLLKH